MMKQSIIVIAEHMEGQVRPVTYELVECALRLQGNTTMPIKVIILGEDVTDLAREIAENSGQDVSAIQVPGLVEYHGEAYRDLLEQLLNSENARYVCVAHSSQGLDFGPALAVFLGADCITGIEDLYDHDGQLIFIRPIYGGKVASHVSAKSETTILCIQAGIFKPSDRKDRKDGAVHIQSLHCRSRGPDFRRHGTRGSRKFGIHLCVGRPVSEIGSGRLAHRL
jgi:electron transfer flavoprotein alpha subunit